MQESDKKVYLAMSTLCQYVSIAGFFQEAQHIMIYGCRTHGFSMVLHYIATPVRTLPEHTPSHPLPDLDPWLGICGDHEIFDTSKSDLQAATGALSVVVAPAGPCPGPWCCDD